MNETGNRFFLTLPARVNLLGNPSDANEGAHATISAAVDLRAGAVVESADVLTLERLSRKADGSLEVSERFTWHGPLPIPYDGQFDLMKGALNRLYAWSGEFRSRFGDPPLRIGTWTDVPRQSGLGGSTLFVLLTLCGLRRFYNLDRRLHNDYLLSELAQRVEAQELGITCGFADRYVPLFGGLAYLDYRGKLFHRPIDEEPYVTYERLDRFVDDLPLVIAYTGVIRDSGDVHSRMRARYLAEYERWRQGLPEKPFMVRIMEDVGATAWRGKIALLRGDWDAVGALMNENHRLVNEMMLYCGYTQGAGWANNLLIETALEHGALGAKLTGAGGGGSVFALVEPGQEGAMVEVLLRAACDNGLPDARAFKAEVTPVGLTVEEG